MKISDFKGDDALDFMAEIIEPASKIINDPKTKELRSNKIEVAKHILKNHKKETLSIYELLYQDKGENATPVDLLKMVMDILTDQELLDLFIAQGQNEEQTSSGSATENTEGEKK